MGLFFPQERSQPTFQFQYSYDARDQQNFHPCISAGYHLFAHQEVILITGLFKNIAVKFPAIWCLIPLVIWSCESLPSKHSLCADLSLGTFEIYEFDTLTTIIYRWDSIQVEDIISEDALNLYKLQWLDSCTYQVLDFYNSADSGITVEVSASSGRNYAISATSMESPDYEYTARLLKVAPNVKQNIKNQVIEYFQQEPPPVQ